MKFLGIDYGSKRIGVAASDEGAGFAMPLCVLEQSDHLVADVIDIAKGQGTKEIVMGESKNFKGEPNTIYPESMKFKKELEAAGYIVHLEPEFMTSMNAERVNKELGGKSEFIDASAAALILQSFLDKTHNHDDTDLGE